MRLLEKRPEGVSLARTKASLLQTRAALARLERHGSFRVHSEPSFTGKELAWG
jgi:hypothetical protein